MKKYSVPALALLITLMSSLFPSCAKDETTTPEPTDTASGIVIQLRSTFSTCQRGRSICFQRDNVTAKELANLSLEADQFTSKPMVLADGSIEMSGELSVEKLSTEARTQLFEERVLVVDETFALSDNVVKQAYGNARKTYDGQRIQVVKGEYPIDLGGSGTPVPQKIKITITISKGEITITISW